MLCTRAIKGYAVVIVATTVLFFGFPQSSFAASPFLGQLQNLLSSLISNKTPDSTSAPSASSGGSISASGIPFGGPIIFGPIKCTEPPGAEYMIVGPPVSKPVLCQKGVCKTYDAQPPYRPGQYLLGTVLPTPIPCIVGVTPIPQPPGFPIGNTPGVGASTRGSSGSSGEEATSGSSCPQEQFRINNSTTKQAAEVTVRNRLESVGIGVNNAACGYGQDFRVFRRIFDGKGCTDVSKLQCASTDYLQNLAETCGAGSVVVTGGSELGHLTHDSGNAVDLSVKNTSLQSCLDTKTDRFTNLGGGKYRDEKTKSIFTFESKEAHYHLCIPGSGC